MRGTSIRRKLVGAMFLTSLITLLLTCLVLLFYEISSYKRTMAHNLATVAQIIAANSAPALIFDDESAAQETLSALKAEQGITAACLFDQDGRIYTTYPAGVPKSSFPQAPEADGVQVVGNNLTVFQPVLNVDTRTGTLFLMEDLAGVRNRMRIYGMVLLLVLVGSAAVALLLSTLFQKQIAQPLLELAGTARLISEKKDYSTRARKSSEDELGVLTDALNQMLEQIQHNTADLQKAQSQLREYAEDLERRVQERTARLTQTVGELEAFSYSVSHDLRAPLRSMEGYALVLLEDYKDRLGQEGQEFLNRIVASAHRMDRLIQDVLTLSRVSKLEAKPEKVPLEGLVRSILETYPGFQPPLADIYVTPPLPEVLGNQAALTQCISNLVANAVKFVAPGTMPQVQIWAERHAGKVRLLFRDNGIGIAEKDRERIFGIFQRLSSEYEGTGIGLAIVRKGAERMGGTVGFDSEQEKGSTFWLELPEA